MSAIEQLNGTWTVLPYGDRSWLYAGTKGFFYVAYMEYIHTNMHTYTYSKENWWLDDLFCENAALLLNKQTIYYAESKSLLNLYVFFSFVSTICCKHHLPRGHHRDWLTGTTENSVPPKKRLPSISIAIIASNESLWSLSFWRLYILLSCWLTPCKRFYYYFIFVNAGVRGSILDKLFFHLC